MRKETSSKGLSAPEVGVRGRAGIIRKVNTLDCPVKRLAVSSCVILSRVGYSSLKGRRRIGLQIEKRLIKAF